MNTGSTTASTIETNMPAAGTSMRSPANRSTIIGVMIGASSVEAVVIPTEKGTSPPQRNDMIFDEMPPGEQPTRISPTAISSGRRNTFASA